MATVYGNQGGIGKSKIIDTRKKKGSGDRSSSGASSDKIDTPNNSLTNPPQTSTSPSNSNSRPLSQNAVDVFQGRKNPNELFIKQQPTSQAKNTAAVLVSPGLAAKAGVEGQSRAGVDYALISQRQQDKNDGRSVDYVVKSDNEFVGPKQGVESLPSFTSSIGRGAVKTAERVTAKTLPSVGVANEFLAGRPQQTSQEFYRDSDVRKTSSLVTGPYYQLVEPTVKGSAKIVRSEVVEGKGRGLFLMPDFSFKTAERRLELSKDSDVQTTYAAAGFVVLGAAGKVGAVAARTAGVGFGGYEVIKGVNQRDAASIGTGLVLIRTSRPIAGAKRVGTELFGERILPESITGKPVTSRTVEESLNQFGEAKSSKGTYEVVSASPNKLVGEIRAGPKGSAGVEDPGLYVAPKGRANLAFAGIKEAGNKVESISLFGDAPRPTVNVFEVQNVVRLPRNAIVEPGFRSARQEAFRAEAAGNAVAVITKRSEIGKGAVERQFFSPLEDVKTGGGLVREKGKFYREAGTSESEAVIPLGSDYVSSDVGFRQRLRYTIINPRRVAGFDVPFTGELVRVPKYRVVAQQNTNLLSSSRNERVLTEEFIKSKDSTVSSFVASRRSVPLRSAPVSSLIGDKSERSINVSTPRSLVSNASYGQQVSGSLVSSDNDISKSLRSSSGEGRSDRNSNNISIRDISGNSVSNLSSGKSLYSTQGIRGFSYSSLRDNTQSRSIKFDLNSSKSNVGSYAVELRRFGKFQNVGYGRSLEEANRLGSLQARKTLGATYRIRSGTGFVSTVSAPTGFYKKGNNFIEQSRLRLNTGSEVGEINFFKRNKKSSRVSL